MEIPHLLSSFLFFGIVMKDAIENTFTHYYYKTYHINILTYIFHFAIETCQRKLLDCEGVPVIINVMADKQVRLFS